MSLSNIKSFGSDFDIEMVRKGKRIELVVKTEDKIVLKKVLKEGASLTVKLP